MERHKQRLTVLLFVLAIFMGLLSCNYFFTMSIESYCLTVELLQLSTALVPFSILIDKIAVSFSAIVFYISASVFMFGRWYMKDDPFYYRFVWILLAFVISMNVLIFSGSLLSLLVGWDGLGVSSFALIIYYQSKDSLSAGFLTLLINRLGDVLIMSLMFYFVMQGSSFLVNYSTEGSFWMLLLLVLAALTKSAQYPFSAWLPAAMAAPTPVSALVHSSTLVTAGIYILIRACITMTLSDQLCSLLLFCGSVTSLVGGICAVWENDLKKVIAFSTLSQLGIMVFCLGLGSPNLALLHLYTHAMFKAMLFLVAGMILMQSFGVQDVRLLGSVTSNNPILLLFLNTSTLCLLGLPFLSAYYSKHAILTLMLSSSLNFMSSLMMWLAVFMTGLYMIRMLKNLNWSHQGTQTLNSSGVKLSKYNPCSLLYLGSLLLGWFLSNWNCDYIHNEFLPEFAYFLPYMVLLCSVMLGVFFSVKEGSLFLSSMFFMTPMWINMARLGNSAFLNMKYLEYGWLEPHCLNASVWMWVLKSNKMGIWSIRSFYFGQMMIVMLSVAGLCLSLM